MFIRAPCIEWSEDGFVEWLLPSLPGIPGWTRVIKFVTGALPAESSLLTALFLLLNQHLHTFPSPPLSFFVCACMSLHLCLHAYVADVRNHLQSAAVLFFVVGPQSNTDLKLTLEPANLFWRFHLCFPRPPHPPGIYMVLGIWNLAFLHAYRTSTFLQPRFLWLRCRNLHFPEY